MFSSADYLRLQRIMEESPEKKDLLTRLLDTHQMTISTISHEIRNPLTLVSGTMQLIETRHPEVLHFTHWSEMHQDIAYMTQLLNELTTYNNGERLNLSFIDMNTFFKTLALSFATTIVHTEIQFISHISSGLPSFYGDSVKLKEVFLNLLSNARDAVTDYSTCNAEFLPTIRLSVSSELDSLIIRISDNGCGMSQNTLSQIFEPFVTFKKNGTGLGLAIASKIIHSHKGAIHAESLPGIHTTFTVSLPVQKNG